MWYVDIYIDNLDQLSWINNYHPQKKNGPYGGFYQLCVPETEKRNVSKKLHKRRIKSKWYKKEWGRADDCRKIFLKVNKPPYRCRYCHRSLNIQEMEVDHLVPVSASKNSADKRNLLYIRGIKNVNDIRNLVPSCKRCNNRKGSKTGLWYVRGILGKYSWYWALIYACRVLFIAAIILSIIVQFYGNRM